LREGDIRINEFSLQDLFALHRIIDAHKQRFVSVLKAEGAVIDAIKLLEELGPAPNKYKAETTMRTLNFVSLHLHNQ